MSLAIGIIAEFTNSSLASCVGNKGYDTPPIVRIFTVLCRGINIESHSENDWGVCSPWF